MKEKIYWSSEIEDTKKSKKECKEIAEGAKLVIKEIGQVEIISKKTNEPVGYVTNPDNIINGWCGIDFVFDDPIADYVVTQKPELVFEKVEGSGVDKKILTTIII